MRLSQVSCEESVESLGDLLLLPDPLSRAVGDEHHLYLCVAATAEEILKTVLV